MVTNIQMAKKKFQTWHESFPGDKYADKYSSTDKYSKVKAISNLARVFPW